MSIKTLLQIPVWKGNRMFDPAHAKQIRAKIATTKIFDSGYILIQYCELDADNCLRPQLYLIDGQHRAHLVREDIAGLCVLDFPVTVTIIVVKTETDAINYFNAINNVKILHFEVDPNLIANKYIVALETAFNTTKHHVIRATTTKRPYLSTNDLRDVLIKHKLQPEDHKCNEFIRRAIEKNKELLTHSDILQLSGGPDAKFYKSASEIGFMLAVNKKLNWIGEIVKSMTP